VNGAHFGRLLAFGIPMVLPIFLPCYFGSEMSAASEKLTQTLFHTQWIGQSKSFKQTMTIFMENNKKALKFAAFEIFTFNLEKFVKIINSVYSFYVVLENLNE
jgi:hypothetical protein